MVSVNFTNKISSACQKRKETKGEKENQTSGMQKSAGNQSFRELNEGKTSSGIGFKFSLMYPTEGGINALLFPVKDVKVI